MQRLLAVLALACPLLSCANSPTEIVVEKRIPTVSPVTAEDCPVDYGAGSIEEVIKGLGAAVGCERANNAAERAWRKTVQK